MTSNLLKILVAAVVAMIGVVDLVKAGIVEDFQNVDRETALLYLGGILYILYGLLHGWLESRHSSGSSDKSTSPTVSTVPRARQKRRKSIRNGHMPH